MRERMCHHIVARPLSTHFSLESVLLTLLVVPTLVWSQGKVTNLHLGVFCLLLLVTATETVRHVVMWGLRTLLPANPLPRLSFEDGLPDSCSTILVLPALLLDVETIDMLVTKLERWCLAHPLRNLHYALLTDFVDSDAQFLVDDARLLDHARRQVRQLAAQQSARGGGRVLLLHRRRQWNSTQRTWMGWERKRGKLEELTRWLRGAQDTSFIEEVGSVARPKDIRFVITLDEDCELPDGAVAHLVGTIAHPLNHPVFDEKAKRVVSGYGVIQPCVTVTSVTAAQSRFALVSTLCNGMHPDVARVWDIYQDLYGHGSYVGKGIYDVDAFLSAVSGRIPENCILSHDILEGAFLRAAAATDLPLYEEFPPTYTREMARRHRWTRGDWQCLPWILPRFRVSGWRPQDIPSSGRSVLFDTVRRSLLAPASFGLLVAGFLAPPTVAYAWIAAALFLIIATGVAPLLTRHLLPKDRYVSSKAGTRRPATPYLLGASVPLALLADTARVQIDAIIRTLVRLTITRRNLLEWKTASQVERELKDDSLCAFWARMWTASAIAVATGLCVALFSPHSAYAALPIILAWLGSPVLAWWLGKRQWRQKDKWDI